MKHFPRQLYSLSVALLVIGGFQVYGMLPQLTKEARDIATLTGIQDGKDRVDLGRSTRQDAVDWQYTDTTFDWWAAFMAANFLGTRPSPPVTALTPPQPPPATAKPIAQIIELVSLVYDSRDQGRGELSHVIVRYKFDANVRPPEWHAWETAVPSPAAALPLDTTATRGLRDSRTPGRGNPVRSVSSSALPGRDILQKVWIQGAPRPSSFCSS